MSGWQPINSAPRDGTRIIGFNADQQFIAIIAFDDVFQCWVADDEDCWFQGEHETSHWMPLPNPPANIEQAG